MCLQGTINALFIEAARFCSDAFSAAAEILDRFLGRTWGTGRRVVGGLFLLAFGAWHLDVRINHPRAGKLML